MLVAGLPALGAQQVTQAPTFGHHGYVLSGGRTINVRLATHSDWPTGQTCPVSLAGGGYRTHTWRVRGVVSDLLISLTAPRHIRGSTWRLSARCKFPGVGWSRTVTATIHVRGRGRLGLSIGSRGPLITALAPTSGAAVAGFGGAGIPPNPFPQGECTWFAYHMRPDIYLQSVNASPAAPAGGWDAGMWARYAAQYGHFQEGPTPVAQAIMVEPGSPGHVAYVSQVIDPTHWVTQEMHTYGGPPDPNHVYTVYNDFTPGQSGYYWAGTGSNRQLHRHAPAGTTFIYGGPVLSPPEYAPELGHIVQWNGDTKPQKTAWLVLNEGGQLHRHWIPSIAVYWCLKNSGAPGPDVLPAAELNQLTDDTGVQATCSGNSNPPGGGGGGAPGPTTYSELEGHNGSNTFSDPVHASGTGPRINPGQTIQVLCKVYAPQIASVKPDGYWYAIATSPWNSAYYAPANTFMNGDPWNGPYSHNTDMNVPDCTGATGPTTTPTTTTPPPQSWTETVGGNTNTWTDYTNAGGAQGSTIAAYTTVQVACAVEGFRVADGNTWWYRIASSPWNSAYYASADAFYNNGQTSGSLQGTPFIDPAVPTC